MSRLLFIHKNNRELKCEFKKHYKTCVKSILLAHNFSSYPRFLTKVSFLLQFFAAKYYKTAARTRGDFPEDLVQLVAQCRMFAW